MATLFCFAAIIAVIIGICRYNEDEKLFWPMLLSFVGAFAIATAVSKSVTEKKSNNVIIESAPTQVLQSVPCSFYTLADISLAATLREKSPKPVSKDCTSVNNIDTLSEVHVSARGQPYLNSYYDDS